MTTDYENDSAEGRFAQRAAEEFHVLHTLINGDAHDYDLDALPTADKTSLVAAIRELFGLIGTGGGIVFHQPTPASIWTISTPGVRKEPTVILDGDSFPVETDVTFPADTEVTVLTFPHPVSGFAYF